MKLHPDLKKPEKRLLQILMEQCVPVLLMDLLQEQSVHNPRTVHPEPRPEQELKMETEQKGH